jgi:hypothetical protein
MPNPDEELEKRLARLKGVDIDQVRHPGKGLANDPLETSQDDSLLLHDHSSYTIVNTGDDQDPEGLVKEVSNINKEVSIFDRKIHADTTAKLGISKPECESLLYLLDMSSKLRKIKFLR